MHKYLRAVGFSKVKNSKDMHEVIMNILENADHRDYISGGSDDTLLAEFKKEYAEHIGVVVCGEFDEDDINDNGGLEAYQYTAVRLKSGVYSLTC